MSKSINLISREWNDIIFSGKNKDYGAYDMRRTSSKRHIIAFLVCLAIVVLVAFLPLIIKTVTAGRKAADNISESTVLADLKALEEQVQEKDIIRQESAPPPPPLKSTIQFTAPEIVEADKITDDDKIKSQEELAESKVQISVATVDGANDGSGIDIADLQQHKVIAEDTVSKKVFEFVQQMPEFPGGTEALQKYLSKNIEYPSIAAENGVFGRVVLKFVIDETGQVSDVQVIGSVDRSLDEEAVRVVKAMPKWIPGKQNGKPVKVYYNLPVVFELK